MNAPGLSKNKLKYLRALRQKKYRQKYDKFIVEGDKIAREFLLQQRYGIEWIIALPHWVETHQKLLQVHFNKTLTVSEAELQQISLLHTPNQVLLVADRFSWSLDPERLGRGLSLYLDGIRDPGNLGTIIRIADWFGLDYIFCSPDCVEEYMPKVVQSAMGALLRVPVLQRELAELRALQPHLPICGTVLDGDNVFEQPLPKAALLVVGNESRGVSAAVREQLTQRLRIPAHLGGGAESLNVAVATGIFCAQFRHRPRTQ
ncbi:MAG: RNA methyltransferase [Bacteroidota bacterium]